MLAVQKKRKEDVLVGVCGVVFCQDVGYINIGCIVFLLAKFEEVVIPSEILY